MENTGLTPGWQCHMLAEHPNVVPDWRTLFSFRHSTVVVTIWHYFFFHIICYYGFYRYHYYHYDDNYHLFFYHQQNYYRIQFSFTDEDIPGQASILQFRNCWLGPWQRSPPFCGLGLSHLRSLIRSPVPQVLLHLLHSFHGPQPPSVVRFAEPCFVTASEFEVHDHVDKL